MIIREDERTFVYSHIFDFLTSVKVYYVYKCTVK